MVFITGEKLNAIRRYRRNVSLIFATSDGFAAASEVCIMISDEQLKTLPTPALLFWRW